MIDINKIITDCPKSIVKYKEHLQDNIRKLQKVIIEDKELAGEVFNIPSLEELTEVVKLTIPYNVRVLYDFFDEQGIKIFIGQSTEEEGLFTYFNTVEKLSKVAFSRIEAEELAFTNAFYLLEKQLP